MSRNPFPISSRLSAFVSELDGRDLAPEVHERVWFLLLDVLGIAVRASHDADLMPSLLRASQRLGLDAGHSTVIGIKQSMSPAAAAWLNGTFCHVLDFDDTHAASSLHPSAPVVPAALAAAEMTGASGEDLLAGIVAGYEVAIRLALALDPSEHYARGHHPTATCGAMGATAAAARVLGLSESGVSNAFGITLGHAAGSMQFLSNGAWTKALQVGHASQVGLTSALLAAEGFKGPDGSIEGVSGFLHTHAPNPRRELVVDGLGERFETLAIAVKPYPSCRYGHAALDALIGLCKDYELDADEIERVEVGLPKTGWNLIGNPEESKWHPESIVEGQFSMAFVAAVAIRTGGLEWDDYPKHLTDDATLDLTRRVECRPDSRPEAEFPRRMAGWVRIHTKHRSIERFAATARGEPELFPTERELRKKFDSLVQPILGTQGTGNLADSILRLGDAADLRETLRLVRSGV